jgi:hypothetical protein
LGRISPSGRSYLRRISVSKQLVTDLW